MNDIIELRNEIRKIIVGAKIPESITYEYISAQQKASVIISNNGVTFILPDKHEIFIPMSTVRFIGEFILEIYFLIIAKFIKSDGDKN